MYIVELVTKVLDKIRFVFLHIYTRLANNFKTVYRINAHFSNSFIYICLHNHILNILWFQF